MTDRTWPCQIGAKCLVPCPGCPGVSAEDEKSWRDFGLKTDPNYASLEESYLRRVNIKEQS